jgi:hypothetical protein
MYFSPSDTLCFRRTRFVSSFLNREPRGLSPSEPNNTTITSVAVCESPVFLRVQAHFLQYELNTLFRYRPYMSMSGGKPRDLAQALTKMPRLERLAVPLDVHHLMRGDPHDIKVEIRSRDGTSGLGRDLIETIESWKAKYEGYLALMSAEAVLELNGVREKKGLGPVVESDWWKHPTVTFGNDETF